LFKLRRQCVHRQRFPPVVDVFVVYSRKPDTVHHETHRTPYTTRQWCLDCTSRAQVNAEVLHGPLKHGLTRISLRYHRRLGNATLGFYKHITRIGCIHYLLANAGLPKTDSSNALCRRSSYPSECLYRSHTNIQLRLVQSLIFNIPNKHFSISLKIKNSIL